MVQIDLLGQILDLIEQHGLSVVLLVVSILLWVFVARWLGKKFDEMWSIVKDIKEVAVDPKKERVEFVVKLNMQIKALLREALVSMNCGWVQLWQFHNGTRGLGKGKIPYLYISLTHEASRSELDTMRVEFAHLPFSMFDTFGEQLISNDITIHSEGMTAPVGSTSGMGKMMKKFGAKSSAMRVIRDEEGEIIGFMSFVFTENEPLDQNTRNKLLSFVQRMTATLAVLEEGEQAND